MQIVLPDGLGMDRCIFRDFHRNRAIFEKHGEFASEVLPFSNFLVQIAGA